MTRIAVFGGRALRGRLKGSGALEYELVPAAGRGRANSKDAARFAAGLVAVSGATTPKLLAAARRALPGRPIGGLALRPDAPALRRIADLDLDFVVEAWRSGDPLPEAVLAHVSRARRGRARHREPRPATLQTTARRLAILTDVVKTANSILEPRKVIELVIEKIRQLIPSEAWSLLMVDEEKQELVFEAALGAKGREVQALRPKIGEGVAGWVAQTGKPAIVNDTARDPRFSAERRRQDVLRDPLDPVRAAHLARPHDRRARDPEQAGRPLHASADLELVLTLVEPCAIAIENAILFQRTEQLTITDDLTRLFNSRYLNLYLGREIKRCKRHGIPLSVIFLDLDGFKSINDQYGHLAGSGDAHRGGRDPGARACASRTSWPATAATSSWWCCRRRRRRARW